MHSICRSQNPLVVFEQGWVCKCRSDHNSSEIVRFSPAVLHQTAKPLQGQDILQTEVTSVNYGPITNLYCRRILKTCSCLDAVVCSLIPGIRQTQTRPSDWQRYLVLYRPGALWLRSSQWGRAGLDGNVVHAATDFLEMPQLVQPLSPEHSLKIQWQTPWEDNSIILG